MSTVDGATWHCMRVGASATRCNNCALGRCFATILPLLCLLKFELTFAYISTWLFLLATNPQLGCHAHSCTVALPEHMQKKQLMGLYQHSTAIDSLRCSAEAAAAVHSQPAVPTGGGAILSVLMLPRHRLLCTKHQPTSAISARLASKPRTRDWLAPERTAR
jgi:hypothetical protein